MLHIIFGCFLLVLCGGGLYQAYAASVSKNKGTVTNAKFISRWEIMSPFNHGYALCGGFFSISKRESYEGGLLVGPSGSGKTSTVIISSFYTIARGGSSICCMDVSGELFAVTSGYMASKGYKVYSINFGPDSDCFNPLLLCSDVNDIMKVAQLIIKNAGVESKSDPYWSSSGEMMLCIFMEYLVFFAAEEHRSMAQLVWLLDVFASEPMKIDRLFVATKNEQLLMKYKAMNSVGEKTLQSTLSTVRTALKIFGTPAVRACTATNTVDFSKFRKEKSVLYINTPLNDVAYFAPLSALLFESLFKELMKSLPKNQDISCFCLIDELVQMRFSNPGLVWSNCRKYKFSCLGVVQDERSLEMAFSQGQAHAIRSNSHSKIYLPNQPLATCEALERIFGKTVDDKGKSVPLMDAAAIRMCNDALILVGNKPPCRAKLRPYYSHWKLKCMMDFKPFTLDTKTLPEPPLIQFDEK